MATPPFHSLSEALAWLDAHINYEATAPSARALPTLAPMVELAHLLGDPQDAYPSVHVTGTNGKGSTAAMVTALFGAMGLRVGTYTSPNLSRVNERIALPFLQKLIGVIEHCSFAFVIGRGEVDKRFAEYATHACSFGFFRHCVFEVVHIRESRHSRHHGESSLRLAGTDVL